MEWVVLRVGGYYFDPQNLNYLQRYIEGQLEHKLHVLCLFDSFASLRQLLSSGLNSVECVEQLQADFKSFLNKYQITADSSHSSNSIPSSTSSSLEGVIKSTERECRRALCSVLAKRGIAVREIAAAELLSSYPACLKEPSRMQCIVTEGSIALDGSGREILLKGAADASCIEFAKVLQATRIEVLTETALFTALPSFLPSAYLVKQLHYSEARELLAELHTHHALFDASLVPLLEKQHLSLHIKVLRGANGDVETLISKNRNSAQVKAVYVTHGLHLLAVECESVECKNDVIASLKDIKVEYEVQQLLHSVTSSTPHVYQLSERECSRVSIIGQHVSSAFYTMSASLKLFQEHENYFMYTSGHDAKMSFVLDRESSVALATKLHASLFTDVAMDTRLFGSPHSELFVTSSPTKPKHRVKRDWWVDRRDELLSLTRTTSPLYVYNEETLQAAVTALQVMSAVDRIFYAIKANSHPDILKYFYSMHLGFEMTGEVGYVLQLFPEISRDRILFTPNFAPQEEYRYAFQEHVIVTIDSKYPLQHWPQLFKQQKIFLRIDPGRGDGHHQHVNTAGKQSKFGISAADLPEVAALIEAAGGTVVGLHSHLGSGIYTVHAWRDTAMFLSSLKKYFPNVDTLDLGGGLGVIENNSQPELDLEEVNGLLLEFKEKHWKGLNIWIEPGRYLVALSGVLLTCVTQLKSKEGVNYIGINTGFNSLIRPVLYGAYHEIVNLSKLKEPLQVTAEVVGNICESGDVFGHNRRLPVTEENDTILIATTGAYGYSMSSHYNMRSPPNQLLLKSLSK